VPASSGVTHPALAVYARTANAPPSASAEKERATAPSFGNLLAQTVRDAIDASRKSETLSIKAASGKADLQDVVEAVNAAEISLQTVVSIRDRVISAYQEILRMPI
jgi:flagellar hook-basal body complex protein FliE